MQMSYKCFYIAIITRLSLLMFYWIFLFVGFSICFYCGVFLSMDGSNINVINIEIFFNSISSSNFIAKKQNIFFRHTLYLLNYSCICFRWQHDMLINKPLAMSLLFVYM